MDEFHTDAQNAALERLLSSLVNEAFVKAFVLLDAGSLPSEVTAPVPPKHRKHWMCVTSPSTSGDEPDLLGQPGIFLVPLRGLPAIQELPELADNRLARVTLLDPQDPGFPVQQQLVGNGGAIEYVEADVGAVTRQLLEWNPSLSAEEIERVTGEIANSVEHQAALYHRHHGRTVPALERCSSIELEQLVVEGHPIHFMHRSRIHVPPVLPIDPWNNSLSTPEIHFFAVPRSCVTVRGEFEKLVAPLVKAAAARSGVVVDSSGGDHHLVLPVHHVQVPSVVHHFPFARQLPFSTRARAQASVRTVVVEELPALNLKLPIGVIIGSATRTITPWTTHVGPSFKPVADRVIEDENLLELAHELASVVSNHPDSDIAKHLGCVIRQDPGHLARLRGRGERVVICAALTNRYPSRRDDFVVNSLFHLDSPDKKEAFFRRYARLFLAAFFPPLVKHGLCFEAHLQNALARFRPVDDDRSSWELVGFTVRDLGGIKVHQETLKQSTGLELDVWDAKNCCQVAERMEEIYQLAYHTMIQGHLNQLARALELHYNGKGWDVVREELDGMMPGDCLARRMWLENDTVDWKAFMTMKLQGLYRDYLYTKVANLITYRGQ